MLARWTLVRLAGELATLRARGWARAINAYAQKLVLPRDDKPYVAKSTATPVKERARGCAPSCGRSAACIKPISNTMLRPTRRSSMPSASRQP